MTPDERQMIEDFFRRLGSQGAPDKDREAERLIADEIRRNPDAAYLLVQTALVYEHQFGEMEQRIHDLEEQVANAGRSAPQGTFLGGRLGGRTVTATASSSAGFSASPRVPAPRSAPPASPWSSTSAAPARDDGRAAPWAQRQPQAAPQNGGGGFFRSAMATAAGVAGGLMLGDALRGMFGGEAQASEGDKSHTAEPGQDSQQSNQLDANSDQAFFEDMGGGDSFEV